MKLITNIKESKRRYQAAIDDLSRKDKVNIYLIAMLFTLFFISAPVALIINLYLFVDYFYLVSFFVALTLFLGYNLFFLISGSMFKRKLSIDFSLKYCIIENLLISFILCLIIYLIIIFIVKGLVI